jgi:hypothetical protein
MRRWQRNPPLYWPINWSNPLLSGVYWMNRGAQQWCVPWAPHSQGYENTVGAEYTSGEGIAKSGVFGTCLSAANPTSTVLDQTNAGDFGRTYAGPTTMFGVWSFESAPVSGESMFRMYGGGAAGAGRRIFSDTVSRVRISFGRNDINAVFTFAGNRTLNAVAAMHYGAAASNAYVIYLRRGNAILRFSGSDSGEPIDGTATARVEVGRGAVGVPEVYLCGVKRGAWSESQARQWLADPWQIYAPSRAQILTAAPVAPAFNPAWAVGSNQYLGGGYA